MTVPPDEGRDQAEPPLDFDPYRFGKPDHPIAPEYAPPGYQPSANVPPYTYPPPQSGQPGPPTGPPPGYGGYGPQGYGPQGYGPPQGYRPPNYPPYDAPRANNTKATIALVLGVLSLLFCWLSLIDLVFIVPAIILGLLGRGESKRDPRRGGRSAATSGLVCGIVALVLAIGATVYIYDKVKPCLDKYSASSQAYKTCATDRITGN